MLEDNQSVQDVFLDKIHQDQAAVTIYLVNGVKLQGVITWFDSVSMLLRRNQHAQLVYKHAISTICPTGPVDLMGDELPCDDV